MSEHFDFIKALTTDRESGVLIWILNIGAEKYWNPVNAGIVDRNEDMIVNRVEEMNLLLCREQDILILRENPDEYYTNKLLEWGFSVPTILVPAHTDPLTPISELVLQDTVLLQKLSEIAREREDVYFVPYAVTTLEEQIAAACGLRMLAAPAHVNATVNDKIFNREIAETLNLAVCSGKVCHTIDEIKQEYERLVHNPPFFEKVIIKEPHGASGKGLYIVDSEDKLSPLLARVARFSRNRQDAKWLVEGWYRKSADINFQLYVSPQGNVDVFSIKQQILRDAIYIGSKNPAEIEDDVCDAYREFGQIIGRELFRIGYTGVAGIDSIITDDGTIIPIIEINGRFTLSTYVSFVPLILGEYKIFSRYFKLNVDAPLNFQQLCEALDRENLLYRKETGEGVLVYTSGTLPMRYDEGSGTYSGRVFTLICAQDWPAVKAYNASLETFITNFSNRHARTL